MILILKAIGWGMTVIFVAFLWITSVNLTKPFYNHTYHVWEEDKGARQLSNLAITLMLSIAFLAGHICG